MHTFKRIYLLVSLAAALIIPTLVFTEYVEAPPITNTPNQEYTIPQATTGPIGIPMALEKDVLDIAPILWAIYFIGLAFFGIKFLKNLVQIIRRIHGNPKQRWQQFFHVLLKEPLPPHTFLSYIFLNKSKFEANEIPKEVLLHEQTHARQKHSYDILFVEFLQVIFWINPFIYLLKKSIKLNHEFLADQAVIKKGISQTQYQNTLLSYLSHHSFEKQESTSIANAINYSSIKKRFNIMKTKTSKKAVLLRSLLVLPLFSLLLLGFSETKVIQKQIKSDTHINKQINEVLPPIKIYVNEKQEITIEEEIIAVEDISNKLSRIIKSVSTKPNSVREIHIEAKGNLNIKLLKSIKEQITKEDCILKTVTADTIKGMNKTLENYSGIAFIARDTLQIKQDDGTFVLGFTTKENPVNSKTQNSANTKQDSATTKELAEYNKLAKHYNNMSRNKMKIYKKDVERLEYLFSKMSDEQKSNAEPFPDFPEPPPAPKAPNAPNEREEAENTIQKIIDEQDPYDVVNSGIRINPKGKKVVFPQSAPLSKEMQKMKVQENLMKKDEAKLKEQEGLMQQEELKLKSQEMQMEKEEAKLESQEILMTRQEEKMEEQEVMMEKMEAEMEKKEGLFAVQQNGAQFYIPKPPTPPTPVSPLDHVIAMAKKDAQFFYEGEEISSDRAINLMKTNKDLNIDSRTTKGKRPVVKISTSPIEH